MIDDRQYKINRLAEFKSLYFFRAGNKVKIGRSRRPRMRRYEVQPVMKHKIEVLAVIPYMGCLERMAHIRMRKAYLYGEWFRYTPEIYDVITEMKAHHQTVINLLNSLGIETDQEIDNWLLTKQSIKDDPRKLVVYGIRHLLQTNPTRLCGPAIAEYTGLSTHFVHATIDQMITEGVLVCSGTLPNGKRDFSSLRWVDVIS